MKKPPVLALLLACLPLSPPALAETPIPAEIIALRDPFKRPAIAVQKSGAPKSELESYAVDAFTLVGVLSGPDRTRAILRAPNGKNYFVTEKTRIGLKRGFVYRIFPDSVKFREKSTNLLGQDENLDTEIRLLPEREISAGGNSQAVTTTITDATAGAPDPNAGTPVQTEERN